jgi:hypothetical protein
MGLMGSGVATEILTEELADILNDLVAPVKATFLRLLKIQTDSIFKIEQGAVARIVRGTYPSAFQVIGIIKVDLGGKLIITANARGTAI